MFVLTRAQGKRLPNDNVNGRIDVASLESKLPASTFGLVKRLGAAHSNGVEGLPMYAAGVTMAIATGVPMPALNAACMVYLASRLAFNIRTYFGCLLQAWRSI
jgi:uncharacterized MAPEG superfamily protein